MSSIGLHKQTEKLDRYQTRYRVVAGKGVTSLLTSEQIDIEVLHLLENGIDPENIIIRVELKKV